MRQLQHLCQSGRAYIVAGTIAAGIPVTGKEHCDAAPIHHASNKQMLDEQDDVGGAAQLARRRAGV